MIPSPLRTDALLPDGNPFATRCVRPGEIPFCFPPGLDAGQLVARLAQHGWRGEITGPHGSGKTTLLVALQQPLRQRGRRLALYWLGGGRPQPDWDDRQTAGWDERTQVVVDGYEQLTWRRRLRLHRSCWRSGAGVLVTAHRSVGFAQLHQTRPCLDTAQRVVANLLPDPCRPIGDRDVARCFRRRDGDLREMLFDLYDLWEERRRA